MQLVEVSDQFKTMGVNIAAMTYDSVEILKSVEENEGISFYKIVNFLFYL